MGRRRSRHGQGDLATVGVRVAHADRAVELVDDVLVAAAVVESDEAAAAAVFVETGNETTRNGRTTRVRFERLR